MDKTTHEWFDATTVRLQRDPALQDWHIDEELIRLAGAPKGSSVSATITPDGDIELRVVHPQLLAEPMVRLIVQEPSGYVFHIVNAVFVLRGEVLGKGIGPRSVSIEIAQAKELGYFSRIRTYAVGDARAFEAKEPLMGYYVWPLMGFDAKLPAHLVNHQDLPVSLRGATRLLDLFSSEKGEAFEVMNAIDILRRVTKPKTDTQAVEAVVKRYGSSVRENVSNDDPVTVRRASGLSKKRIAQSKRQGRRGDKQYSLLA